MNDTDKTKVVKQHNGFAIYQDSLGYHIRLGSQSIEALQLMIDWLAQNMETASNE